MSTTGASRRRKLSYMFLAGTIVTIIGLLAVPSQTAQAKPTFTGGGCSSSYSGCHSGALTPAMMTVTGLPAGSFVPGQTYNLKVTITDTNTLDVGQNAFDMLIVGGSLASSDPNVVIVDQYAEAKANTGADLKKATTFNVSWTAPVSGSASFEIWGIMGDGAGGTLDIWDREVYSYNAIPEFPVLLLPAIGVGLTVVLASKFAGAKKKGL